MDIARDILRARNGDESAFERIHADCGALIGHHASRFYAPGLTRDDLEQEGRLGLWKAVKDFRPDQNSSFRSFARLCIERQIITAVKTAQRGKHKPLNDAADLDVELAGARGPLEEVLDRETLREMLFRLEWILSEIEREAVIRIGVNGQSYAQVAGELGFDEKAIDNALQRARTKLADVVEREGECQVCGRPSLVVRCEGCEEEMQYARRFLERAA